MSNGYPYLAASARDLQDLSRNVDDLRRDLDYATDELRRQVRDIDRTAEVAELVDGLEHLRTTVDDLEENADDLKERVDGLERTIGRLRRDTQWLMQRVRAGDATVPKADLDALVRDLAAYAKAAARGRQIQADFLDDNTMAILNGRIEMRNQWRDDWRGAAAEVLAATGDLPGLPGGGDDTAAGERAKILDRYDRAATRLRDLAGREAQIRGRARDATTQLEDDRANRTRNAASVDQGARADAQLRTRIRTALHGHVAAGADFPTWFTRALGYLPDDQDGTWMTVATDVLAYRATYDVDDPLNALGTAPANDGPRARQAWHTELADKLKAYS